MKSFIHRFQQRAVNFNCFHQIVFNKFSLILFIAEFQSALRKSISFSFMNFLLF